MYESVLEIDVHGLNSYQAKTLIDSKLKKPCGAYRLRIIHGYHGGSVLSEMITKEYKNNSKVLRIERGLNIGQTDLILKEL